MNYETAIIIRTKKYISNLLFINSLNMVITLCHIKIEKHEWISYI